jgi:hypothetical protein
MSYRVPGDKNARHVVFDAPRAADGSATISATPTAGRCAIEVGTTAASSAVTASSSVRSTQKPLVFEVAAANDRCVVRLSQVVATAQPAAASPAAATAK